MLAEGYEIRPLDESDAAALAAAYEHNREHLAPWDPDRPARFYTEAGQAEEIARALELREGDQAYVYLLWRGGTVAGRIALNNIARSVLQSGTVGYWVAHDHTRRGLATAMVEHVAIEARGLGLHRLEAGTRTHNEASQAVLRKAGFEQYGVAERFLFIGGEWTDHVLFQRILHDDPPGNPPTAG
ncbi:GNAT family protein [Nocardioides sp.]|uniref:GNAT family N-acetyltransferase n=1 Tax=Nocardioides sp. TaxID=35761 RepID=UPI002EDBB53B